jgi:hydrophobic/amphiphilic exporter-1 (mainly G- bacteria), HAE1 family
VISQFFIERPIFANAIAIVTIIIGLVCLYTLPVSRYPDIVPPTIQVTARYPGASASVVAATIGIPIEQAVNGVEGSIYMASTSSSDGTYTLTITFNVGTNLNASLALVQNLVNTSLAQLPGGAQQQGVGIRKVSPNFLLVASLYSEDDRFPDAFLSNYASINLQYPLGRVPGVSQVRVFGASPYSMRVWLDPNRLQGFGISTSDVQAAIQGQNVQVAAGQLGISPVPPDQPFQFTINSLQRLSDVRQFEEIVVKSIPGPATQIVRLRDVARIELGQQNYSNFSTFRGHKAANVGVFALPDANAIDTADLVYAQMAKMSRDFPAGLKYDIKYDTTTFVREAVRGVYQTLFIAGILVLVVIFVFLQNLRATLVPATTVPVTIIGTFIAITALGFTINLMTLFALILAIGIVVDDAIIIVENSSYHIEQGMPPKEATIKAMRELTGPVMGITLALVSVFLPAAFLPGITGQVFRQFALVIASTAVISAINALTLKPVQCATWLKPHSDKPPNRFHRAFDRGFLRVTDLYMAVVTRMVLRPWLMLLVFAVIISLAVLGFLRRPTGFLPTEDQGFCILLTRLPEGSSLPRLHETTVQIDQALAKTAGVEAWVDVGGLSILDAANVPNIATTFIIYKPWSDRSADLDQEHIIGNIYKALSGIQEGQFYVAIPPPVPGLGQTGGFQMMVEDRQNLGLDQLHQSVTELVQTGNRQQTLMHPTSTFSVSNPQIYVDIDRTKAEALQVPISNVFETLQGNLGSTFVNLFNKFNQVYQVYIQADAPYRLRPRDIQQLYVKNRNGGMVPLSALTTVRHTQGTELITRYNLYPAAAIFGSAAEGHSSGEALGTMERLAAEVFPQGISYDWTSTSYQERQVGNQAYFVYALSILMVFMVLAALYESWTSPAAVILVVPMALVGVLLALLARGFGNDLYTQVGLILMIALASKNAILIVEYARELHHGGMKAGEAAIEATRRRFRPIVMTSFAFILGVTPLLFARGAGAASQRAMGTVVFGGMLSSTLLAIPFVPVFYVVMEAISERIKGWRRRGKKEEREEKPPSDGGSGEGGSGEGGSGEGGSGEGGSGEGGSGEGGSGEGGSSEGI